MIVSSCVTSYVCVCDVLGLSCESFVVVEMVCVVGLARLVSGVRRAVFGVQR